jgi:SET domain-containing protein
VSPALEVRPSPIHGRGVFATAPIAAGSVVHLLDGERLNQIQCGWRILRKRLHWDDPLQIGRVHFLALDQFSVAFNHGCTPTCGMRARSELFALDDIAEGTELTYDYSMTARPSVFTRSWRVECNCGSPQCRRSFGNFDTLPLDSVRRYVEAGAVQDYMIDVARRRAASSST